MHNDEKNLWVSAATFSLFHTNSLFGRIWYISMLFEVHTVRHRHVHRHTHRHARTQKHSFAHSAHTYWYLYAYMQSRNAESYHRNFFPNKNIDTLKMLSLVFCFKFYSIRYESFFFLHFRFLFLFAKKPNWTSPSPRKRTHKIFNQPEILECRRIRSYQCLSIWLIIAYRPTGNFLNSYTHSIFQHQCNWFHIQTVNKNEWKQIDTRRWVHFVCTCTMCAHLHFKRKKKELVKLRHSNRDRENSNSRTAKKTLQLYSLVNYTIIIRCRWNLFLIFFSLS